MPERRVQRRPGQVDARPGRARPQPVAPRHPAGRHGAARRSEFRVECREWTDGQIGNNDSANDVRDVDLDPRPHAQRPHRGRGRRARRPARRRHPRPRPGPAGDRRRARPGLGLHRHLRQGQRRRLPHRLLPRRLQGDLGLPRPAGAPPGTSRASGTPASPTPGCSAPRRRRSCWPGGTAGSRRSSTPTPTGCRRSALPPLADNALAGTRDRRRAGQDRRARAPAPCPPRENGGNHDIKNFTRGARVFYPVHVPGAHALRRRPALQPGRRRDHLLRRHRDGRLHRLPRRPHQGRHGEVRRDHQPGLHAGQRRAALLGVPDASSGSRSTTTPTPTTTSTRRWPTGTPASTPSSTSRRSATPGSRRTCFSARRRSRAASAASSTSRTPAARSTCPRRSSTSTSVRRPRARAAPTAASAPCPPDTGLSRHGSSRRSRLVRRR